MKLRKMCCAECGAEVVMTYERVSTAFCINDEGNIEIDDNNMEGNELIFHCSEDMCHRVRPKINTRVYKLWEEWEEQVLKEFYNKNMEEIY